MLKTLKISAFLCLIVIQVMAKNANVSYGLSFNSHQCLVNERTSLSLDGGEPFTIGDNFTLSFNMLVRSNESPFGSILHFTTDDGHVVYFSLVVDNGKAVPAFVCNDQMAICHSGILMDKWVYMKLGIDAKRDRVTLYYRGKEESYNIPLYGTKHLSIQFGKPTQKSYVSDVAPMILKDVKVEKDCKTIRWWKLGKHNGNSCLDEEAHREAVAINASWVIDNHIAWRQIYHVRKSGLLGTAFNDRLSHFYLCTDQEVITLGAHGNIIRQQNILGGFRANPRSNGFVAYDPQARQLISFSLQSGRVSRFDAKTSRWSLSAYRDSAAMFYNHAYAYNPADSSFYFFGGYGYYTYRNELFRLRAGDNKLERVNYSNPIPPRFAAAMGIANGKLYILGGRGNKMGKQAVESYYYCELWAIDLKTKKAELVWRRNSFPTGFMMAATMYYQPRKKAFYAMNMNDGGGTLYQVGIADTTIVAVAKPIANTRAFQDFEYNMFYSSKEGCFYLMVDKILADKSHDLSIYQLSIPILSEMEISQEDHSWFSLWKVLGFVCILVLVALVTFFFYVRKRKPRPVLEPAVDLQPTPVAETEQEEEDESTEVTDKGFDRTHSAISLLGTFSVYDKDGMDITAQFTPRLKELLLLLILYSEKRHRGVSVDKVTEIIWFDKEEASARNNRNVTLRKLRVLLERVGDVEIASSNGYLSFKWGQSVFCDYHAIMGYVSAFNSGDYEDAEEQLACILELLLYGPLLPGYETEWLDGFKDAYSSLSIDLLYKLLRQEKQENNEKMILRIADILFLHDPLNDEALAAKCQVLCQQGKKGVAKRMYDHFCKEYEDSMSEEYEVSFADLVK